MSSECYLIVVYVLPSCFEFRVFLNFCLLDASVLNTQIVNRSVLNSSKKRAESYIFGEDFGVKA